MEGLWPDSTAVARFDLLRLDQERTRPCGCGLDEPGATPQPQPRRPTTPSGHGAHLEVCTAATPEQAITLDSSSSPSLAAPHGEFA